jgi:hypothetical protein
MAAEIIAEVSYDAGLAKDGTDLDQPPWQHGRYGTAVGRAVHGVLQRVDLATGVGLDEAVMAQVAAEAVQDGHAIVRALAEAALRSPLIGWAVTQPYWREVFVGAPVGDHRALEGYIDLLVRGPEGLVVVDYKTDGGGGKGPLDESRLAAYRLQLAGYAEALALATGEVVDRAVLLFLRSGGAVEHEIADLEAARAEVRGHLSRSFTPADLPAAGGGA